MQYQHDLWGQTTTAADKNGGKFWRETDSLSLKTFTMVPPPLWFSSDLLIVDILVNPSGHAKYTGKYVIMTRIRVVLWNWFMLRPWVWSNRWSTVYDYIIHPHREDKVKKKKKRGGGQPNPAVVGQTRWHTAGTWQINKGLPHAELLIGSSKCKCSILRKCMTSHRQA